MDVTSALIETLAISFAWGLITSQLSVFVLGCMEYGKIFFRMKRALGFMATAKKVKYKRAIVEISGSDSFEYAQESWNSIFLNIAKEQKIFMLLNCQICFSTWVVITTILYFGGIVDWDLLTITLVFAWNYKLL